MNKATMLMRAIILVHFEAGLTDLREMRQGALSLQVVSWLRLAAEPEESGLSRGDQPAAKKDTRQGQVPGTACLPTGSQGSHALER